MAKYNPPPPKKIYIYKKLDAPSKWMLLLPVLRNRIRSKLEKPDQDQNEKQ
jgi:hypothetical protein